MMTMEKPEDHAMVEIKNIGDVPVAISQVRVRNFMVDTDVPGPILLEKWESTQLTRDDPDIMISIIKLTRG
jgi:hypothetical protein